MGCCNGRPVPPHALMDSEPPNEDSPSKKPSDAVTQAQAALKKSRDSQAALKLQLLDNPLSSDDVAVVLKSDNKSDNKQSQQADPPKSPSKKKKKQQDTDSPLSPIPQDLNDKDQLRKNSKQKSPSIDINDPKDVKSPKDNSNQKKLKSIDTTANDSPTTTSRDRSKSPIPQTQKSLKKGKSMEDIDQSAPASPPLPNAKTLRKAKTVGNLDDSATDPSEMVSPKGKRKGTKRVSSPKRNSSPSAKKGKRTSAKSDGFVDQNDEEEEEDEDEHRETAAHKLFKQRQDAQRNSNVVTKDMDGQLELTTDKGSVETRWGRVVGFNVWFFKNQEEANASEMYGPEMVEWTGKDAIRIQDVESVIPAPNGTGREFELHTILVDKNRPDKYAVIHLKAPNAVEMLRWVKGLSRLSQQLRPALSRLGSM